jgi:hypothetical protein
MLAGAVRRHAAGRCKWTPAAISDKTIRARLLAPNGERASSDGQ